MDDNFTIKGNYHSNAGFLIHNSSWAEAIEYDDVTSCGHKNLVLFIILLKKDEIPQYKKKRTTLLLYMEKEGMSRAFYLRLLKAMRIQKTKSGKMKRISYF